MRFSEFRKALRAFTVISYPDILKVDPLFDRRRLVEWQHQNYIKKIINGHYIFTEIDINEGSLFHISNNIYKPSYISLESSLSFYNLIPEAVYLVTGISTKKTVAFDTPIGNFAYRSINKNLFWGYSLVKMGDRTVKLATPEKGILDLLYLNRLEEIQEFEGLRLNLQVASDLINFTRLKSYLSLYRSKIMERRVNNFIDYINAGA